ncbi:hypothetical protein GYMLUDRAFT_180723 [Collybiopsis luxurians FD-317 M1]|uniref:Uncharacterized protein n=1 Tax=Collybiopsis luxurians FD-317 M1 TaxID=944289 RepID=A0A0D0BQY6_9AGAR|nr:hypothetical protein GYMLUDRAFT_180723 [Collybiopsis luxurians FD-317 M1]
MHQGIPRPNIHAAGHVYDFLLLFGPVISWWCFPFEQLIRALQKINTNDHIGGEMESTIVRTVAQTANLRHWLRHQDCPKAICQLKVLFDKCFVPANAPSTCDNFIEQKGPQRAYVKHNSVNLSPCDTHAGNANIIYCPSASEPPVAGQIQRIENIHMPDGKHNDVHLHVRHYNSISKTLYDPFLWYPHLLVKSYSSPLNSKVNVIDLDDVVAHPACYDYSHGQSVLVNLSRA